MALVNTKNNKDFRDSLYTGKVVFDGSIEEFYGSGKSVAILFALLTTVRLSR